MVRISFFLPIILFFGCQISEPWTPLFNGENLDGWHIYGGGDYNGWYIEDGVIAFDPQRRIIPRSANLITNQQYTNFELSFQWMISENGNSGFFWGVVEDKEYDHPYQTGPEIQILDDGYNEYIKERGNIQRAGSIFNILAPSKIVSKGDGEWNHYLIHIDQKNNEGFVDFNGERILDFPVNGSRWKKMIEQSNFKNWDGFGLAQTGRLCFQDHGHRVAFRDVKIRELD